MIRWAWNPPNVNVVPGEWTRISLTVNMTGGDILDIQHIYFKNYSRGDTSYIDNVVIIPIGQD